jgi:hypothetical protein
VQSSMCQCSSLQCDQPERGRGRGRGRERGRGRGRDRGRGRGRRESFLLVTHACVCVHASSPSSLPALGCCSNRQLGCSGPSRLRPASHSRCDEQLATVTVTSVTSRATCLSTPPSFEGNLELGHWHCLCSPRVVAAIACSSVSSSRLGNELQVA